MAVFKCKMCGGDLEITEGVTVTECEYCGTKQTVPKAMDENLQALFNRANTLRIKSEFDKAEKLYEKIIQADPSQAEAYWGLILCRYGIEYVDDPATFKKVPTCHRASFESVVADDDFKAALEHADMRQRILYEEQAKEIDRIQKEILALAQKEENYDVFICYKETDADGHRTQDSVIANDIYYQLTGEGFKVFYAAITLEGKLGSAYEPIIFAALNSAKVMLAIGTRPEHFGAVWVKNEWSRFLKIVQKDRSKLLIPCYRDMDAYELPEEFAHLQAQDMSKIGFINDIVRGIKKVVRADAPKKAEPKTPVTPPTAATTVNVAPLLERAFIFLEDGDWESADEYCEKVLDQEPKNAEAYLGKLMVELHVKKEEDLKDCKQPFDNSNNYQKALRFATDERKATLIGYVEHINTRNENARSEKLYTQAQNVRATAKTEEAYKSAASLFASISSYKDSAALEKECLEDAEAARKNSILWQANNKMGANRTPMYKEAVLLLASIRGWRDADELVLACEQKIAELEAKAEAERLEKQRKAELARIEAEKRKKRNKMIAVIAASVLCAIIAFVILLNTVIIPNGKYNDAIALMDAEKYADAIFAFKQLAGYKDSESKISECNNALLEIKYNNAILLMEEKRFYEAMLFFQTLNGYKDSVSKIKDCKYERALASMQVGKYTEALSLFEELGGYKDSAKQAETVRLQMMLKSIKVGECINFGVYEQDNDKTNGKEKIEWIVLDITEGKALVISKYALDVQQYNTTYTDVAWETCTLREWLNNSFISSAFSTEERSLIPTMTVLADNKSSYSNPENNTKDKVFLLNVAECRKYFSSDQARKCKPTDAIANKAAINALNGTCYWWLRSHGNSHHNDLYAVDSYGSPVSGDIYHHYIAVRPALWIDLNA